MKVAVIGGGINGVMSAWALSRHGFETHLYERDELMDATSSASTKLIHGGLRYLENFEFRLVREALRERTFWLFSAPHLVRKVEIVLPVYTRSRRKPWFMRCGLALYDLLAGKACLGHHPWLSREHAIARCPNLRTDELLGAFTFFDAQMDDRALGLWAAHKTIESGVTVHLRMSAEAITEQGEVRVSGSVHCYDLIVNAAGPWSERLLTESGIASRYRLDLVRGSHLYINRPASNGFLVEVPDEERFCFILPYGGRTLLGTTEVRESR